MANEFTQDKQYAEIYEAKELEHDNKNELRVYCWLYPNTFILQIRTHKPITNIFRRKKAKKRNMIARCYMSIQDMKEVLNFMESYKPE